jgi:hypothetical protein
MLDLHLKVAETAAEKYASRQPQNDVLLHLQIKTCFPGSLASIFVEAFRQMQSALFPASCVTVQFLMSVSSGRGGDCFG